VPPWVKETWPAKDAAFDKAAGVRDARDQPLAPRELPVDIGSYDDFLPKIQGLYRGKSKQRPLSVYGTGADPYTIAVKSGGAMRTPVRRIVGDAAEAVSIDSSSPP
jgi:hypothetical protein